MKAIFHSGPGHVVFCDGLRRVRRGGHEAGCSLQDPSVTRDANHRPITAPERTPFDPFKGFEVVGGFTPQPLAGNGKFGSPDLHPASHQVDPKFGTAAVTCR